MNSIRKRVLSGEILFGAGAYLGSSLTVEMIGITGFDFVWIDCEHGVGDLSELLPQLQAASIGGAAPVVRIVWNEAPRFKRVLDLGAAGVMVPYVNTAAEARAAAQAMRYPPEGVRGVARLIRANGFGQDFQAYFSEANEALLTVVQIETAEAVKNADEIAAVEGVDVLFIGPMDLSNNMGIPAQFEHPDLEKAMDTVLAACHKHGKAPGILAPTLDLVTKWVGKGFTFLVVGSDLASIMQGLKSTLAHCKPLKKS